MQNEIIHLDGSTKSSAVKKSILLERVLDFLPKSKSAFLFFHIQGQVWSAGALSSCLQHGQAVSLVHIKWTVGGNRGNLGAQASTGRTYKLSSNCEASLKT